MEKMIKNDRDATYSPIYKIVGDNKGNQRKSDYEISQYDNTILFEPFFTICHIYNNNISIVESKGFLKKNSIGY